MKKCIPMLLTLLMMVGSLAACGSLPNNVGEVLGGSNNAAGVGYPEDGCAEGYLGDTMHTAFFDFTINSAYTCMEFDGLAPEENYKFLVAEIMMKNTTTATQPMSFLDFQVQWDIQPGEDEETAFGWPLYEETENDYITVSNFQLPTVYDLGINEERTGILLYMVPEGARDYSISFEEYFENDETGDLFFVWFNAEEK